MRGFPILPVLMISLALVGGCVSTPSSPGGTPTLVPTTTYVIPPAMDPVVALDRFTTDVNASLRTMDDALSAAADDLTHYGITGPAANTTLARLANASPYAVDAVTISAEGYIAAVMPEQYQGAIGVYVGNESHNEQALRERKALMTPVFPAAEGFDAVSIRRPVWNETGTFLGLVTVLFKPAQLLGDTADRALAGANFSVWAMQTDGVLIYDKSHPEFVGHNLITDPLFSEYPDLVALAERMAVEPTGNGTYALPPTGGGSTVRMEAIWETAGLHGTDWRLVVAREA